jgi:hypothetical protein
MQRDRFSLELHQKTRVSSCCVFQRGSDVIEISDNTGRSNECPVCRSELETMLPHNGDSRHWKEPVYIGDCSPCYEGDRASAQAVKLCDKVRQLVVDDYARRRRGYLNKGTIYIKEPGPILV